MKILLIKNISIKYMEVFKYNKLDIGIDEAGRGPFCGPVYAGAVIWKDNLDCDLINYYPAIT